MKAITTAILLILSSVPALAKPEGAWPEEARSLPLGRPAWVLVVPATRDPDGSIRLWDRQDQWLRSWIVPKATPGGIRTVAISGDSEDQKLIQGEQLDNMRVDSLKVLARKYSAEAVAVVVRDSREEVAVAAWREGAHATWNEAMSEAGAPEPRREALAVMDELFADASDAGQVSPRAADTARVVAERLSYDGVRMEYRLEIDSSLADMLRSSASLEVTRIGEGTADVLVMDGRDIADILLELGIERRE